MKKIQSSLLLLFVISNSCISQIIYPGIYPGKARIKFQNNLVCLKNKSITAQWNFKANKFSGASLMDNQSGKDVFFHGKDLFELKLKDGRVITSDDFVLKTSVIESDVVKNPAAPKFADRLGGKKVMADLIAENADVQLHWEALLNDGSNYVRQVFKFSTKDSLFIEKIHLVTIPKDLGVYMAGVVDGSPLIAGNMFFALEHPMSQTEKKKNGISLYLPRQEPLISSMSIILASVWGTTPPGQLRRGFLYYTERERSTPYRQNLHYNSWYDLSWIDRKMDETSCIDRIQTFADSLIEKRKVPMNTFLFDDGWDDNKTLWQFNSGFPQGFSNVVQLAKKYNVRLGTWISPWGGYMEDQKQRLDYGRKQVPPFETNENGFSLAGPVYYNRFKQVATTFLNKYEVNMFKFDGVGAGNGASGASLLYQKDIEALLKLVGELRTINPSLYLNLTVGTWPSVYWLNYGDAIWRAGMDTHGTGAGSKRQQWITYRDAEAYKNVVQRAPLFPLNAVMYHGICIAPNGPPGKYEMSDKDIADEIWAFFGAGSGLQELYIDPHSLNTNNWNTLASAAQWSKRNKDVLADVHWVGGNPEKGDVYGFAAWTPQRAVLTLRNPSNERKTFKVDVNEVFEPSVKKIKEHRFYNAKMRQGNDNYVAKGQSVSFDLEPFDVLVFDVLADR